MCWNLYGSKAGPFDNGEITPGLNHFFVLHGVNFPIIALFQQCTVELHIFPSSTIMLASFKRGNIRSNMLVCKWEGNLPAFFLLHTFGFQLQKKPIIQPQLGHKQIEMGCPDRFSRQFLHVCQACAIPTWFDWF